MSQEKETRNESAHARGGTHVCKLRTRTGKFPVTTMSLCAVASILSVFLFPVAVFANITVD